MNISASIDKLVASAVAVFMRFPLVLVFSSVVFCLLLTFIYNLDSSFDPHKRGAVIWGIIIALPLYFNYVLISEWNVPKWIKWVSLVLLIVLPLKSCYVFWIEVKDATEVYIELATFVFVHGVVASGAYLKFREERSYWQYNSLLLLNFINSAFYVAVISIGILAGFGLIGVLFKEFFGRGYSLIFAFIVTFFHPFLFLAWLPERTKWEEGISVFDLPKFFRTLIIYILIPLSVLYLLILYAYIGESMIIQDLPNSTIGWTVLVFTVASVLSLVLVYPYRKNEDQKFVYWFSKLLPFALTPLVLLLWVAIGLRVGNYGFTPSRVLLTLLAIWLTLINAYLYTGKKWGLMPLAGALTLLSAFAIGWPINAKSLSIWSQQSIQRTVLEVNNIAEGDSVTVKKYLTLSKPDRKKLESTDNYLRAVNSSLVRVSNKIVDNEDYYDGRGRSGSNSKYYSFKQVTDYSFLLASNKKELKRAEIDLSFGSWEKQFNEFGINIKIGTDFNTIEVKDGNSKVITQLKPLDLEANGLENNVNNQRDSYIITVKVKETICYILIRQITVTEDEVKFERSSINIDGEIFVAK
jgi:hypothetical protein